LKLLRHFWIDLVFLLAALVVATIYGGAAALELTAILVVVEIVFSFDNATVNARILERMNLFWRKVFLTVGVLIAVFGMRLVFPLVIVSLTAKISPWRAVELAGDKGDVHREGTYGYLLAQAHPSIAAFGGMFLLLLALDFLLDDDREVMWLVFIERHLKKAGRLQQLPVVVAGIVLAVISTTPDVGTRLPPGALRRAGGDHCLCPDQKPRRVDRAPRPRPGAGNRRVRARRRGGRPCRRGGEWQSRARVVPLP